MSYFEIAVLALIQGAAELLPVSSSAHVIVALRVMGHDPSKAENTFLLATLHTGTMFAVLYYFWPRWRKLLSSTAASGVSRLRLPALALLATAVTGVVGGALVLLIERVFLKRDAEELSKNLPLIAIALFAVGLLIVLAGRGENQVGKPFVTLRSAVWIGLVQALCLPFRGFSRSGATISTALLRGIARPLAEDFSFALALLVTPPVIARELYRLLKAADWTTSADLGRLLLPGLLGMVCSFAAGLVALRFLSAMLERGRWKYFGFYCLLAASVVAVAAVVLPAVPPQ